MARKVSLINLNIALRVRNPEEIVKGHHQPVQCIRLTYSLCRNEEDHHLARTINKGLEFIGYQIHASDNWFLQLECFDPRALLRTGKISADVRD